MDNTLPFSLLCITMILCVHRIFFEITTFSNTLDVVRLPSNLPSIYRGKGQGDRPL